MAHTVNITIHCLASSCINGRGVNEWLKQIGATEFEWLRGNKTDAETLIELAGRRCYMSFQPGLNPNVTRIRREIAEYIDNILKSSHGSVLEHATYTFAFEGVSRIFTGEMNRHRAGWAISEGSMRYIRLEDMGYWLPPSIQGPTIDKIVTNVDNSEEVPQFDSSTFTSDQSLAYKRLRSRAVFQQAFNDAEKHYAELQEIWKDELSPSSRFKAKKEITSMMRRIVPMGVATGGIWTGNIRAIRHVITMRCTPHAEEEIAYVFSNVLRVLSSMEPNLFGDFQEVEGGFFVPKYVKV